MHSIIQFTTAAFTNAISIFAAFIAFYISYSFYNSSNGKLRQIMIMLFFLLGVHYMFTATIHIFELYNDFENAIHGIFIALEASQLWRLKRYFIDHVI